MATITVEDLIELLGQFNPKAKVRLAHQYQYPLHAGVSGVAPGTEGGDLVKPLNGRSIESEDIASAKYIYLTEDNSSQGGHASTSLWHAAEAIHNNESFYIHEGEEEDI